MTMTTAALLVRAHDGVWTIRHRAEAATVHRRVQARDPRRVRTADRSGRASRARCCVARACTARIWRSGARPATPGLVKETGAEGAGRRSAAWSRSSWTALRHADRTSRGRAGEAQARRWRSWEKHELLERLSESGTPRTEVGSRDRRILRGDRSDARRPARRATAVGRPRATHYRHQRPPAPRPPTPRPAPPNKLTDAEATRCWRCCARHGTATCRRPRCGPLLFDDGIYLCSISTMYRLLRVPGERPGTTPPAHPPGPGATRAHRRRPDWSCGRGTSPSCKGPRRGVYYDLFVVIDIFTRYVVGWMVSPAETGELAEAIHRRHGRHAIGVPTRPALRARRPGTSMTSKPVVELLVVLGVGRSHSRPHVTNDNPYSEGQFKTLKYCPAFPDRFGSIEDARSFCDDVLRPTTTTTTATPASAAHPGVGPLRHRHRDPRPTGRSPSTPPTPPTPPDSDTADPTPPKLPTIAWINEPEHDLAQNT